MDPIIKADSLAYPMLHVPNLDKQEQFLIYFGIIASDILQPHPPTRRNPLSGSSPGSTGGRNPPITIVFSGCPPKSLRTASRG